MKNSYARASRLTDSTNARTFRSKREPNYCSDFAAGWLLYFLN